MEKWRKRSGTRNMYSHSGARGGNTAQPEPQDDLTASVNKLTLPKQPAMMPMMGQCH